MTLAGLLGQNICGRLVLADQSPNQAASDSSEVAAALRLLRIRGWQVDVHRRTAPKRGIAEQRQFLLDHAEATYSLHLDDDVFLEPGALARLLDAVRTLGCGFVGMPLSGPSYVGDERLPDHVAFELWNGPVRPERVRKGSPAWERWRLHNAANPFHLADRLPAEVVGARGWAAYKVAWIAGCVLFRTESLRAVGGYRFWQTLPANLRGEDVVAQLLVLERDGGAGILTTGASHQDAPTPLDDRSDAAYTEVLGADSELSA